MIKKDFVSAAFTRVPTTSKTSQNVAITVNQKKDVQRQPMTATLTTSKIEMNGSAS